MYLGELVRYRMLDPIFVQDRQQQQSRWSPLQWWKQKKDLYHPAFWRRWRGSTLLSRPGTSAASERLFSAAGNAITDERSRLTDDNAENIVFLLYTLTFTRIGT